MKIVSLLESKILFCTNCGTYPVQKDPLTHPPCPACGETLAFPEAPLLPAREVEAPPPAPEMGDRDSRYLRGPEIGRGGLGRVIQATDRVLGREVAIKEMVGGEGSDALHQRFLREGEIAGKLSHPNVIPIHDIGVREDQDGKIPYFVMTRILGRDLGEILEAIRKGRVEELKILDPRGQRHAEESGEAQAEEPGHAFSRHRFLRIFQDVCLAIAYAHDHGVIHRDLKPANIMVGKYGEVFVVDWGLAKVKGAAESPAPNSDPDPDRKGDGGTPGQGPLLTLEGEILGTPSYMAPEQAEGRLEDIDERTDIYALGAILYECLTLRPPYEGDSRFAVITQVRAGHLTPPSLRISQWRDARGVKQGARDDSSPKTEKPEEEPGTEIEGKEPDFAPLPIPPDLEEIVLQAMARERRERFGSVMELNQEIERFLEGEKERERNRRKALEKVAEGRTAAATLEMMRERLKALDRELDEKSMEVKPFWPVERKADFLALKRRMKTTEEEITRTFLRAERAFQTALEFERGNEEARGALADFYWDQYRREEEAGNVTEMIRFENLLREYNDGQYDAALRGDGTLQISTRRFPCDCLLTGRKVTPKAMQPAGLHPHSGLPPDHPRTPKQRQAFGPDETLHLKVHGKSCKMEAFNGADVWLFRHVERTLLFVPEFPEGVEVPGARREEVPGKILDACYDEGSPFRPKAGLSLGQTPIPPFPLPMGSYLLIVAKEGYGPLRVPVHIGRLASVAMEITLFEEEEIPEGFLQIPAGSFIFQGDPEVQTSGAREIRVVDDFFMAKYPITCREYRTFLNALAKEDSGKAEARAPRKSKTGRSYWPQDPRDTYHIPTESWIESAPEALKAEATPLEYSPVWWDENWPLFSVSWLDLMAYAAWRMKDLGYLVSLSPEVHWEKAFRGPDGRFLPWGNEFDETLCNVSLSREDGMKPFPVDSYPADESPYGVRGLGGNSRDLLLDIAGAEEGSAFRECRGGFWANTWLFPRVGNRSAYLEDFVHHIFGGRLVLYPQCQAS
ncbi:MAG: bifunctional serine/threonine-protein kinase/formylglycine-generating enzyme family protein [Planctomycetota bacterium]|jgi:serine/threonine protein kinase/formylglycine-generating enzyme required for sulfatase activity